MNRPKSMGTAAETRAVPHPDKYVLAIPAPCEWIRSNHRRHFHATAALTRTWRERAAWLARQARIPHIDQPVKITAVIHRTDRRRADAPNAWPSVKAAIDGLVDAGVLTDDSDEYVAETAFRPGEIIRGSQLTLILEPVKETP